VSAVQVFEGNASWDATLRTGRTGPFATFGLAADDGQRFEVVAFGAAVGASGTVRKGDRLRVGTRRPPADRAWRTTDGSEHHGVRLVAVSVEILDPLPAGEARQRVVDRIISAEEALEA